jgi:N-acetylmuramic acid 6-phosphate etherase
MPPLTGEAMDTEDRLERYSNADTWPAEGSLEAMLDSQMAAFVAARKALPALARAAEEAAVRLERGGRLVYAGAGASGRLAVQDGAELHPTFGWPRERLSYVIAGGEPALVRSIEGAEDDTAAAVAAVDGLGPDRVHLRRAAAGARFGGANDRSRQQPRHAAARRGRDPGAAADRAGVSRRLDPDECGHRPEDCA